MERRAVIALVLFAALVCSRPTSADGDCGPNLDTVLEPVELPTTLHCITVALRTCGDVYVEVYNDCQTAIAFRAAAPEQDDWLTVAVGDMEDQRIHVGPKPGTYMAEIEVASDDGTSAVSLEYDVVRKPRATGCAMTAGAR